MRAAAALAPLLALALSGCLGVDNMAELKAATGFAPEPEPLPEPGAPVARLRASATLAGVTQDLAFTAEGSEDPQGLPLAFAWDLGDGARKEGAAVRHAYRAPGIYTVRLAAANPLGLEGHDTLLVTITENRPPTAALRVLRGEAEVARAWAGQELRFLAEARDPEGQGLSFAWSLGDGGTALTPEAAHAYARGGRFTVTLRVEDPGGLAASAGAMLTIDQQRSARGSVAVGREREAHALDVAEGAQEVRATARFDRGVANGLALALLDAAGSEVARAALAPEPGRQGAAEVVLLAQAADLAGHPPGDWSLVVERLGGIEVAYDLTAEARY